MKVIAVIAGVTVLALCKVPSEIIAAPAQSQLEDVIAWLEVAAVEDQISFIKAKRTPVRVDPAKCQNDQNQLELEPFASCGQFIVSLWTNPLTANSTGAERFCRNNCPQVIINMLHDLVRDCGIVPNWRTEDEVWLNSTCATNSNGALCGGVYSYFNASVVAACIKNYNGVGPCPAGCRMAEDFVRTSMGCCYGNFVDFYNSNSTIPPVPTGSIPENYWKPCGEDVPKACPC